MDYMLTKEVRQMIREEASNMSIQELEEALQRTYMTKLELEMEAMSRGLMMSND